MGFMGLSNWVASDGAADFRYMLLQALSRKLPDVQKRDVREVVSQELNDMANDFNTPGYVNLALCLEVQGEDASDYDDEFPKGLPKFDHLLTLTQLKKASRLFSQESSKWNPEYKQRLKELHQVIVKLIKSRSDFDALLKARTKEIKKNKKEDKRKSNR